MSDGTQPAARPEWVPEKFWDPNANSVNTEALAKSYVELERKASQPPPVPEFPSWEALTTDFSTNRKLSDGVVESLTKTGLPAEYVNGFGEIMTAYVEAAQKLHVIELHKAAGGEENFNKMLQWAGSNLSDDEVSRFNNMLASEDYQVAIDALIKRSGAGPNTGSDDTGTDNMVQGDGGSSGVTAFASQFEMVEAINKRDDKGRKLYEIDENYRNSVRKRIALTNI